MDRWVILALGAKSGKEGEWVKGLQGNKPFIRFAQAVVKSAADEAGMSPRAFQAAIWGGFRKEWDAFLKAAGERPMGGDNDFFENLLLRKMKEYDLRSPAGFKLNSNKGMAQLLDEDLGQAEVEFWQASRAKEAARLLKTSPKNADAIMNDIMYAEWNKKIAAAHLLDTGEIPPHVRTQEVIDDINRTAENYRRSFRDRIATADTATLKKVTDVPEWQKREIAAELEQRTRTAEVERAPWKALPAKERDRLKTLGWGNVPDDPRTVADINRRLTELDQITTETQFRAWAKRNADIVGDPAAFYSKQIPTGEMYTMSGGKAVEKNLPSPYWEPKSFYENRLVFNVEKAKNAIRQRFPRRETGTNVADVLGVNWKKTPRERLGECGISAASRAFG